MHELACGRDPVETKKEMKHKAASATLNTLANVCQEYIQREHSKLRTARRREQCLNTAVLPELGSRQIDSIKRSEIMRLLDKVEDQSGQRSADAVLQILRRIFNWHALRDDAFRTPIVKGMHRYDTRENARTRVLDDSEIRKIWQAAGVNGIYGAFVKFLLLTSARRNEAGGSGVVKSRTGFGRFRLRAPRPKSRSSDH